MRKIGPFLGIFKVLVSHSLHPFSHYVLYNLIESSLELRGRVGVVVCAVEEAGNFQ